MLNRIMTSSPGHVIVRRSSFIIRRVPSVRSFYYILPSLEINVLVD